jgi:hypothetical protein
MNVQNIFENEWRACLRAHYFHVIRERDTGNEQSLITVLLQTGFTDEDIDTMRLEALAGLAWNVELEGEIATDDQGETQAEEPVEAISMTAASSPEDEAEAEASPSEPDDDEQAGPPVQLSLF